MILIAALLAGHNVIPLLVAAFVLGLLVGILVRF